MFENNTAAAGCTALLPQSENFPDELRCEADGFKPKAKSRI